MKKKKNYLRLVTLSEENGEGIQSGATLSTLGPVCVRWDFCYIILFSTYFSTFTNFNRSKLEMTTLTTLLPSSSHTHIYAYFDPLWQLIVIRASSVRPMICCRMPIENAQTVVSQLWAYKMVEGFWGGQISRDFIYIYICTENFSNTYLEHNKRIVLAKNI